MLKPIPGEVFNVGVISAAHYTMEVEQSGPAVIFEAKPALIGDRVSCASAYYTHVPRFMPEPVGKGRPSA